MATLALAAASCMTVTPSAPPSTVAPPSDDTAPDSTENRECASVLAAIAGAAETMSKAGLPAIPPPGAARSSLAGDLKKSAEQIVRAAQISTSEDLGDAAHFAGEATNAMSVALTLDAIVDSAAQEGELPQSASGAVEPAVDLAWRQCRYAYWGTRLWCERPNQDEPSEQWAQGVRSSLTKLQPELVGCVREANERLPLEDTSFSFAWRAVVEEDGSVSLAAPVDFPNGDTRADVALCMLHRIEKLRLPEPPRQTAIGSDQRFEKGL